MRKLFAFTAAIILAIQTMGQVVPNAGFENWTIQNLYNEPVPYMTTNSQVYIMTGNGNVNRTTDCFHGTYAANLETVSIFTDTAFGAMFIGTPGGSGIEGGVPFAGMPDSMYFHAKFDIMPGDTGVVYIILKSMGMPFYMDGFTLTGSQPAYTRFAKSLNVTLMPDSMIVIISSSNLNGPKYPGSWLTIDSIGFVGAGVPPFPNGDFENWDEISVEEPDDWTTTNFANTHDANYSSVKSTDSYAGTYALKLENTLTMWGDTMGYITNGYLGANGPRGGMHVDANPEFISGYYKYTPVGPDSALVMAMVTRWDSGNDSTILLDSAMTTLEAQANYTYFEIPVYYNQLPLADTLNISFAAGNLQDSSSYTGLGSILYVDEVEVSYYTTIIPGIADQDVHFKVYPNPASDMVTLTYFLEKGTPTELTVYSTDGRIMFSQKISSLEKEIHNEYLNVSHYARGIYYCEIRNGDKSMIKKLVIK
ncbi:MAG: T9SS type A sorting domain-containing protein [Bacteroidota bacterium]